MGIVVGDRVGLFGRKSDGGYVRGFGMVVGEFGGKWRIGGSVLKRGNIGGRV